MGVLALKPYRVGRRPPPSTHIYYFVVLGQTPLDLPISKCILHPLSTSTQTFELLAISIAIVSLSYVYQTLYPIIHIAILLEYY